MAFTNVFLSLSDVKKKEVTRTVSGFLGTDFVEPKKSIIERDFSRAGGFGIKIPTIGAPVAPVVIKPILAPEWRTPGPAVPIGKLIGVKPFDIKIIKPVTPFELPPPKKPSFKLFDMKVIKPVPRPEDIKIEVEKPYVYPAGFTGETPKPSLKEGVDPTAPFLIPKPLISEGEVIASEKRTPSEPEKVTPITEKIGISKSFIEGVLPLILGAIVIFTFLKK